MTAEVSPEVALAEAKARLGRSVSDFFIRVERAPRVALVGSAGAGKSRLFNRLVGAEVAPVAAQGFTTKYVVTATVEGLTLIDTPSLRGNDSGPGGLDQEILEADVVIHVVNGTGRLSDRDLEIMELLVQTRPVLVALNKADSLNPKELEDTIAATKIFMTEHRLDLAVISAKSGTGLPGLLRAASSCLDRFTPPKPRPVDSAESGHTGAKILQGRFRPSAAITTPVLLHAAGASVGVVMVSRSGIPLPFLDVALVAFVQWLLVGLMARGKRLTPQFVHVIRVAFTVVGAMGYFMLRGQLSRVIPALAAVFDAVGAFITTALVGFGSHSVITTLSRLLPPWVQKMIFASTEDKGTGGRK